ncbi:hypothetical protein HMPREF3104_06045 [Corynebacterium sp. HMSC30G07]|uniref:hypothetical protein n=1 Tax=Corynebacterium sp. HMSC30G07 TaxID=1581072 RepID=UPI0008A4E72A|nr:hypothetical protein [Corynebacterium sp. HMSC30G07]OFT76248.1 hypothetical protein HMPREF3104_06045 [Corynebacterium sp. HMSC30G07]
MQFRKGIIAAATAAAVLTSGVSVAAAEDGKTGTTSPTINDGKTKKPTEPNQASPAKKDSSSNDSSSKEGGSSVKDMGPTEIKDWIAVITAVISLLGTLFAFGQKFMKP